MRKLFLVFSIFVLLTLLSAGIHQKIKDSQIKDIKAKDVAVMYSPALKHTHISV